MGKFLLRVGFFFVGALGSGFVLIYLDPWGAYQGEPPCMQQVRARQTAYSGALVEARRSNRPKPEVSESDRAADKRCYELLDASLERTRAVGVPIGLIGWVFGGISAVWGPKAVGAMFKKL